MKDLIRAFRLDYLGLLIPAYMITAIVAAVAGILLVLFKNGMENPLKLATAILLFLSVLVPFNALMVFIYVCLCKVKVYRDGICAPNPFDVWKTDCVRWHDIKNVREKYILFYKYWVVVSHENMNSVLVPCKLSDRAGFIKTILEVAGKENAFSMGIVK